jgi:hypothetical protein
VALRRNAAKRKGQAMVKPGPKQPRFWGYLGDAVLMVFGLDFTSPHLKKTNDCKNLWSELIGLNFGTLSGV